MPKPLDRFPKMKNLWHILRRHRPIKAVPLTVDPTESKESGPCECCGDFTRTVWGTVNQGEVGIAAYIMQWTQGKVDLHGAHLDLVLGRWGDGSEPSDRFAVSLEFRYTGTGPWFSVIDAGDRQVSNGGIAGRGLRRDEVIGTPLAARVFEICDAIWFQDVRLVEITNRAV
jgi:hypothetical protein